MKRNVLLLGCAAFLLLSLNLVGAEIKKGSTIAFNRGGDIWLMEADGSDQRPWVAGIANVRGRMSWSADNNKLVFARAGKVDIKYPDGGGGYHSTYDLFFAYADSANNWWDGITQTLGAFAPQFATDGSKILFIYDIVANQVNAMLPQYRVAFWDTESFAITTLDFEKGSDLVATAPALAPDGDRLAFILMRLQGEQFTPSGLVIARVSEFPLTDEEFVTRSRGLMNATSPSWSPDGNWMAYISSDLSNPGLYLIKPDLSEKRVLWKPPPGLSLTGAHPSWSSDSQMLLFATVNGSIYKITITGGEPTRLSGPGNDNFPAWCN